MTAPGPTPDIAPEAPITPRRNLTYNLRSSSGMTGTPGVSPAAPTGTANPLQSAQFGKVGGPLNAQSTDNPVSAATPDTPAAMGMSGSGVAQ